MWSQEIDALKNQFVTQLSPVRVYLFGSFADGSFTEESDFNFYLVFPDGVSDLPSLTAQAYRAIRPIKTRPVDILVGTASRFAERAQIPSVEQEVSQKGVLLYGD